jgi:hypothetical protein
MFSSAVHIDDLNATWEAAVAELRARDVEVRVHDDEPWAGERRYDLLVDVAARGSARTYVVEVKNRATTAAVTHLASPPPGLGALLVAPHITPGVADACRGLGVDYADAAGNVRLDLGSVLIDVSGRRPPAPPRGTVTPRLFRASGLKVLFALLCEPDLADAPYRDVAAEATTSLGSVQSAMSALAAAGYLEERPGGRTVHRTRDLFERWVDAYPTNMPWSHERFAVPDPEPWRAATVPLGPGAFWGGEAAAYRLDGYLRAARATVYVDRLSTAFAGRHRLYRDPNDWTVELRQRFWGERVAATAREHDVVPSPLVYADLVADGDPRLLDAARRLRDTDDVLRRIDAR